MKKLFIIGCIFLASCQYHSKDETAIPQRQVKALHQQTLNSILTAIGISGPHDLISIHYFQDSLHRYAEVLFRNTQTGLEKNILVQEGDALNEPGRTYVCMGTCDCWVRAVQEPNGRWGAQCTCTDCVMLVYNLEESQDFFD